MQTPMFRTLYFEDLSVGLRETIAKTVKNEDVIGFAELSGDHNPIHLSEHFARKTRFGGRIVHGLYTASLISAVIGMRLPGPGSVYISQTLNFLGPVMIGDVVDISVEVVELTEKGRRVRLHCECRPRRSRDRRPLDPMGSERQLSEAAAAERLGLGDRQDAMTKGFVVATD